MTTRTWFPPHIADSTIWNATDHMYEFPLQLFIHFRYFRKIHHCHEGDAVCMTLAAEVWNHLPGCKSFARRPKGKHIAAY